MILWHLSLRQVAGGFTCHLQFLFVPDKRIICFFEPFELLKNLEPHFAPAYYMCPPLTWTVMSSPLPMCAVLALMRPCTGFVVMWPSIGVIVSAHGRRRVVACETEHSTAGTFQGKWRFYIGCLKVFCKKKQTYGVTEWRLVLGVSYLFPFLFLPITC